jgi:hypothetical protein
VVSPTTTGMGTSYWGTTTKMATLTRKANMNRLYITGETEPIRALLSDFNARSVTVYPPCSKCGETYGRLYVDGCQRCLTCREPLGPGTVKYWIPLHQEIRFRAALQTEGEYQAKINAALDGWNKAKSVIPAEYKTRHGAMLGGDVVIDGEWVSEPALDTRHLPWVLIARHETVVRDLNGHSLINGSVQNSDTLYAATVVDGRTIYRIAHSHQFGDYLRETYYLPADLWARLLLSEIKMRNITPALACEWLAQSRGCVGTELYEAAADPESLVALTLGPVQALNA